MKTFALPPRNCCVNGHGLQSLTIHSVWISAYKQGLWKGIEGITTWDSKPQRGWKKNKYKSIFILTLKNIWNREDLIFFFSFFSRLASLPFPSYYICFLHLCLYLICICCISSMWRFPHMLSHVLTANRLYSCLPLHYRTGQHILMHLHFITGYPLTHLPPMKMY